MLVFSAEKLLAVHNAKHVCSTDVTSTRNRAAVFPFGDLILNMLKYRVAR